ncbi:hypothetical protein B0T16DRAFT_395121 [Cercophora newfieldiana]|uniref:Cellulase n=1 Tax=Cercophora newfieldiana TaxID=92897 RepID=A0AA39XSE0_9PEZI|nr:hypothetical protein B0T16DRAFT_395121 [Cercophora newfieldiana]
MKLTLAISLLITAARADFFIDYYFIFGNLCSGAHQGCDRIPAGTCCALNSDKNFFPYARSGSYGPAGFTVWTATDNSGSTCGLCEVTSAFGCWENFDPFQTAFPVGLPVVCANNMASSENATGIPFGVEPAPPCTRTVLPNRLSINGRDYAITDENREEIEADFLNQANLKFDFAEKWKSAYKGPTDMARHSVAGQQARKKPESS